MERVISNAFFDHSNQFFLTIFYIQSRHYARSTNRKENGGRMIDDLRERIFKWVSTTISHLHSSSFCLDDTTDCVWFMFLKVIGIFQKKLSTLLERKLCQRLQVAQNFSQLSSQINFLNLCFSFFFDSFAKKSEYSREYKLFEKNLKWKLLMFKKNKCN